MDGKILFEVRNYVHIALLVIAYLKKRYRKEAQVFLWFMNSFYI